MPEAPTADPAEVAPVRPGEALDWPAVEAYMRDHLDVAGVFSVEQFPHGSANLTYRIAFGGQHLVLRRPPFGAVATGGHDMGREYRALSRLWRHYDRAPRALHHCEDTAVVGSEFIVVEYRSGIVVWGLVPTSMAHLDRAGRRIGLATLDALIDLHVVDVDACGLSDLGRPDGFLQRQIDGWMRRWAAVRPQEVDDDTVGRLGAELAGRMPSSTRKAILHNDFKIDNCQFQPGEPDRVTAVFDWDMATLGDPLVDLGTLLNYWPGDDDPASKVMAVPGLEHLGLPSKAEVVQRYAQQTGIDVDQISWYEAFGCWRVSIILRQLFDRYRRGETADQRMANRKDQVFALAQRGLSVLERSP